MTTRTKFGIATGTMIGIALAALAGEVALAHCDGLDGPVVAAARAAFRTGNVNLALIWVQPEHEAEIRTAFQEALVVRKQSPEAQVLADRLFFETLVRVHRAGEGAPFTGLQPAGRDVGPAIPAADNALETGALDPVQQLLADAVRRGVTEHFAVVRSLKGYDPNDVAAGRRYVRAYVEYIHYVERAYDALTAATAGHFTEAVH